MELALSSADVSKLERALTTLVSPFDHGSVAGWREASRHAVADLVGADKSGSVHPFGGEPPIQMDPDDMAAAAAYNAYYHKFDVGLLERRRALGLEVSHWSDVYDMRALVHTEIYNDWSRPSGLLDAMSMTVDFPESIFPAGLMFYHATESAPQFGSRGLALLRVLLPAFKAGVFHCWRFAECHAALASLIDQSPHCTTVVDQTGHVVHENVAMVGLLATEPEAHRVRAEVLRLGSVLLSRFVRKRNAMTAPNPVAPTTEVRTGSTSYVLRAVYLPAFMFGQSAAACVSVERSSPMLRIPPEMRQRFGFTTREWQVALLLARGLANKEIATQLSISPFTALRHTERVLSKLGVHSRAAVAAALAGDDRER